jgi:hypothetical protein
MAELLRHDRLLVLGSAGCRVLIRPVGRRTIACPKAYFLAVVHNTVMILAAMLIVLRFSALHMIVSNSQIADSTEVFLSI